MTEDTVAFALMALSFTTLAVAIFAFVMSCRQVKAAYKNIRETDALVAKLKAKNAKFFDENGDLI